MPPKKPLWRPRTIKALLLASKLPPFESELLLAHVLHTRREHLIAHPEQHVSFFTFLRFLRLSRKRTHQTPLAYLTKQKEFFGLSFLVSKHTLVPRAETEYLVEETLRVLGTTPRAMLIDIGTGTGCIPVAIAKHTSLNACVALDLSKKALAVARHNIKKHHVAVTCMQSDLLQSPHLSRMIEAHDGDIVMTANLPYIPLNEWRGEPSISREPSLALLGGDDGLDVYRKLVDELKQNPLFAKRTYTLVCEMLFIQARPFTAYLKQHLPNATHAVTHESCAIAIITVRHEYSTKE